MLRVNGAPNRLRLSFSANGKQVYMSEQFKTAKVFLVAFLTVACLLGFRNVPKLAILKIKHAECFATVKVLDEPEPHRYRYAFNVNGKEYSGSGRIPSQGLKIGDSVTISYLPDNPSLNSDGALDAKWEAHFTFVLTAALIGAAVVSFISPHARRFLDKNQAKVRSN